MASIEGAPCPVKKCEVTVDLVLRSSDGVLIGAHQASLSGHSDGFPPADAISDSSEPVDLTENAETLSHLMHFVHKRQHPNVSFLKDEVLLNLAVAAEKYMVHSAMSACSLCIQFSVKRFPIRALGYAVQYGYYNIADSAAPLTIFESMEMMKKGLNHDGALFAWLQYKAVYLSRLYAILGRPGPFRLSAHYRECKSWWAYKASVLVEVPKFFNEPGGKNLVSIFDKPFSPCSSSCQSCRLDRKSPSPATAKQVWIEEATALIGKVPALSTYMGRS